MWSNIKSLWSNNNHKKNINQRCKLLFIIDCDINRIDMQYKLEREFYRSLYLKLKEFFQSDGYEVLDYTIEEDVYNNTDIPKDIDIIVLCCHDWPTINNDKAWCKKFYDILSLESSTLKIIPSNIEFILEKTNYINKINEYLPHILLPSFIVTPYTDINYISKKIDEQLKQKEEEEEGDEINKQPDNKDNNCSAYKFVIKENYSAGKEGVSFYNYQTLKELKNILKKKQKESIEVSKTLPFFNPSFIVQQYNSKFLTEKEIRLYFIKGIFQYAIGHIGWIGYNDKPHYITNLNDIKQELLISQQIFHCLPQLKQYYLLRIDYGPNSLLNEIEILPDIFGGPSLSLHGDQYHQFFNKLIETIKIDIYTSVNMLRTGQ